MLSAEESLATQSPAANVTDGREACPKVWFVAFTRSNSERKAQEALEREGFETFLAKRVEVHQWSDRRKKVEVMLIPRVVFVHTERSNSGRLLRHPSVVMLLKAPGRREAAEIPGWEMRNFMLMVSQDELAVDITAPRLRKGEKVVVTRGSLRGMEGYLAEDTDETMRRVTIMIDNLCCATVSVMASCVAPCSGEAQGSGRGD